MKEKTEGLIEAFIVIIVFLIGYAAGCFAMKMDCQREMERMVNYVDSKSR